MQDISREQLLSFLEKASLATYAGGGKREEHPERAGFVELVFTDGDLSYRDSYTGFYRSWGEELVRYNNEPYWTSLYGGGMVAGKESFAKETFDFLKRALQQKEKGIFSVRGLQLYEDGEWKHAYIQKGDYDNFSGYQEIFYKGDLVFFHHVMGGLVKGKDLL